MSKKGFTLVELSVSLVLVSIVLFSMVNLLMSVKDFDVEALEYNNNINSKEVIVKAINNDLIQNKCTKVVSISNTKVVLEVGGVNKTIEIVNSKKTIIYYSNKSTPILSETLCTNCGTFDKIQINKSANTAINVGDLVKITISQTNPDFNAEITYYRAS